MLALYHFIYKDNIYSECQKFDTHIHIYTHIAFKIQWFWSVLISEEPCSKRITFNGKMEVQKVENHSANDIYRCTITSLFWTKRQLSIYRIDSNTVRSFFLRIIFFYRFTMKTMRTHGKRIAATLSTHSTKLTQMATTCHLNLFTTIYCYCKSFFFFLVRTSIVREVQ